MSDSQPSIAINDEPSQPSIPQLSEALDHYLIHVEEALKIGNFQQAYVHYKEIPAELLTEHQAHPRVRMVQKSLTFDRSEALVPLVLFIFWLFIAFRTV